MSKLSNLAQFWREFNLAGFQDRLDVFATDIAQKQDETSNTRGQLITLLQDFKNSNSEEVKAASSPLIKAFQEEVDRLDSRSKYGEKAFFEAYKSVAELYDPSTVLESAIEKASKQGSKLQGMSFLGTLDFGPNLSGQKYIQSKYRSFLSGPKCKLEVRRMLISAR